MDDANYMRRAITLASRTSPDILGMKVGALVVRDGEIVGEGSREFASRVYGHHDTPKPVAEPVLHAERVALYRAGGLARGSMLYVTLEPCIGIDSDSTMTHCTQLIAESGIVRVAVGMLDPNPRIQGRGLELLGRLGVEAYLVEGFDDMIQPLINVDPRREWRLAQKDWRRTVTSSGKSARAEAAALRKMRDAILSGEMMDEIEGDYHA